MGFMHASLWFLAIVGILICFYTYKSMIEWEIHVFKKIAGFSFVCLLFTFSVLSLMTYTTASDDLITALAKYLGSFFAVSFFIGFFMKVMIEAKEKIVMAGISPH